MDRPEEAMRDKKQLRYVAASEEIKEMIRQKGLAAGDKLPSENELAQTLGVSRGTLRQAMMLLRESGLIYNHQGKGNFLRMGSPDEKPGLEQIRAALPTFANAPLKGPEVQVEFYPSTKTMQRQLELNEAALLAQFHLLYHHADEAVAYRFIFVPYQLLADARVELDDENALRLFIENHLESGMASGRLAFRCIAAREPVAQRMQLKTGAPLLYMAETLRLKTGLVGTYAKSYFLPDYFDFYIDRG